jgi:geranylgeranyl diphosphate synthase type II
MFCENPDAGDESVECFMAAIEMIHTYSLIHDDLPALDNDDLRRGRPTVHKAYGEDIAILAGDGLLNYAFETAAKAFLKRPGDVAVEKAFTLLAKKPGIYGMIGGQTLDVIKTGKRIDEKELEYIYRNKTSALIECAMMIGALLGGADDESVELLGRVANCVGMAFQVQDDILDIEGNPELIGKPVLSDEKNDKYTYVTIHGMGEAKEYVGNKSNEATGLLNQLAVKNGEAKTELIGLIAALVNRDR